jgi:hypothetical protein
MSDGFLTSLIDAQYEQERDDAALCSTEVRVESDDDPLCGSFFNCQLPKGHEGDHQCAVTASMEMPEKGWCRGKVSGVLKWGTPY